MTNKTFNLKWMPTREEQNGEVSNDKNALQSIMLESQFSLKIINKSMNKKYENTPFKQVHYIENASSLIQI